MNKFAAIYVPTTTQGNVASPELAAIVVDMVFGKMIALFGGATITEGIGGFAMDNGEIVKEKIFIVKSFTDENKFNANMPAVNELARKVCDEMTQQCVSVETNNGLEFIEQTTLKVAA